MAQAKNGKKKAKSPRDWTKSKYAGLLPLLQRELGEGEAFEGLTQVAFTCSPKGFAGQIGQLARAHGLRATCVTTSTRVIYRFYDPTGYWKPNLAAYAVVKKARRAEARTR